MARFPEERYSERRINIKLTVKITCLANEAGIHCLKSSATQVAADIRVLQAIQS